LINRSDTATKKLRVKRALIALSIVAIFALATFIVVASAKQSGYFIAINDSYSFPHRIYLAKEGAPKIIKRGSIVIFQIDPVLLQSPSYAPYKEKLTDRDLFKKVACVEGDYLERIENRFICYINGEQDGKGETSRKDKANGMGEAINEKAEAIAIAMSYDSEAIDAKRANEVAIVQPFDSEGKPYAISFDYNGTIPKGKLFMVAPHYLSFDSRYFGLIDKSAVKGEILWAIY
jgi:type IV secretory pathway protease TraF